MIQERDDAVQDIRLIPVRAILRQNRFDHRSFIKLFTRSGLQKEEIIRFAKNFIKSENDLAVLDS